MTFTDPVCAADGFTYERSAILDWFKNNHTSPMTREKISKLILTSHTMRSELSAAGHPVVSLRRVVIEGDSLRLTLVLDVSGSMVNSVENKNTDEPSFSRLDLIKHAVASIGAMMNEKDELSIVSFSDQAKVLLQWSKMDQDGKSKVGQIASSLRTHGGTNIPAGVELGVAQGGDHLILLTDGANTSNPPRGTLADHILSKIIGYNGIIHSVGLGMAHDLDTPTLRAISSAKGGLYCFCPDASMVGTVFIHLMANICVHEPGTPFGEHERFVDTLIRAAQYKTIDLQRKFDDPVLNEDLISIDENKGQVEKALANWNTWGRHYLPAFIDAHLKCMTTNFKDASLQGYATPAVRAFIDYGESIFVDITPPVPSCNNAQHRGYSNLQFTQTTMNSTGVCFGPNTELKVNFETVDRLVKIKDVRKGMKVVSRKGSVTVLCVVVSPETKMINLGTGQFPLWITPNHPVLNQMETPETVRDWRHADTFLHSGLTEFHRCYNLVLDSGHEVDLFGFDALTLGHGLKGGIKEHDYLGTQRIVDDLKKVDGWEDGLVELKGLKRDAKGYIHGIIF